MENETVWVSYEEVVFNGRDTFVDLVMVLNTQLRLEQGYSELCSGLKEKFKNEGFKLELPADWEVRIAKYNTARRKWTEEIVEKLKRKGIVAESRYTQSNGWHVIIKPLQEMFPL